MDPSDGSHEVVNSQKRFHTPSLNDLYIVITFNDVLTRSWLHEFSESSKEQAEKTAPMSNVETTLDSNGQYDQNMDNFHTLEKKLIE